MKRDSLNHMNETAIAIEDEARCLPDLVDRVHTRGEAAVLLRSGQPVARIVPVAASALKTEDLIAFLRRWRVEHPEPDEQFAEAIQESRNTVQPPHDPWE